MSSHDNITLYECFSTPFLLMSNKGSNLQKIASPDRADTTMATPPPRIWFRISAREYEDIADQYLKQQQVRSVLSRSYLPSQELPLCLDSESDIVRASALWFLHPVIKAMQTLVPGATCAAEVVEPGVRCDVLIRVGDLNIAVLEYKNRGYLSRTNFVQASIEDASNPVAANIIRSMDPPKSTDRNKTQPMDVTRLGGNAIILTKQAGAYATRFGTKYVALFDWDSLFLWKFAALKLLPRHMGIHGEWAYGTWVEGRDRFRIVLLGFFMKAYQDRKNKGSQYGYPARDPWLPSQEELNRRRQAYEAQQRQKIGSKNVEAYSRRW
ncbi:hypothetical protein GE09DRAFT_1219015 [Coniochaeta sp. 2T2.1]|nr:hypothetical protein GE09DRAFT_1219015 [Coniochaeta sp. 2T2.1]